MKYIRSKEDEILKEISDINPSFKKAIMDVIDMLDSMEKGKRESILKKMSIVTNGMKARQRLRR